MGASSSAGHLGKGDIPVFRRSWSISGRFTLPVGQSELRGQERKTGMSLSPDNAGTAVLFRVSPEAVDYLKGFDHDRSTMHCAHDLAHAAPH